MQPSKVARPPSGPLWVHEIKHDSYQLMVRRDGLRVRRFTCGGHDWADRFPTIVNAALRIKTTSPGESSATINFTPYTSRPVDAVASIASLAVITVKFGVLG